MPKTTQGKTNPIAAAELGASRALSRLGRLQVNVEKKATSRANKIKFLLGAGLEVMMKRDPTLKARVKDFMHGFLTRKSDVAAFGIRTPEDYFEHLGWDDSEEEAALSILRDPGGTLPGASKDAGAARPGRPAGVPAPTVTPAASNGGARPPPVAASASSSSS